MNALIRLTRYNEYPFFVMVTTLLGAAAANGFFGWKLVGVLVANILAVAFAFMINDVEDAPDDALDPAKAKRNPVSAAELSATKARLASFSVAVAAGTVYIFLGIWPFITGLSCLVIAYLYSWRRVRLKSHPGADLLSHGLMLSGLQFLTAYFAFDPAPFARWGYPFVFIVAISLYGELFNELRDLEGDQKAGIKHTANFLGQRAAYWLMMTLLFVGVGSGLITIFVVRLIPTWVLFCLVIFAVILVIPALVRVRRHSTYLAMQESFQKPIEIAGAFSLALQFVFPWAAQFFPTVFLMVK
jgi:4-hydroxybenzoate polyprenyltransferase